MRMIFPFSVIFFRIIKNRADDEKLGQGRAWKKAPLSLSPLPVGPRHSLPSQTRLETLMIHYSDQMLLFSH